MTKNLPPASTRRLCLWGLAVLGHLTIAVAQDCSPNCQDINLSIIRLQDAEVAKLYWEDVVTNFECAMPVQYVLKGRFGGPLASGSSDDVGNDEYLLISDVCHVGEEGLKIVLSNPLGSCESVLTFKDGPPRLEGTHQSIFCFQRTPTTSPPIVDYGCSTGGPARLVGDWIESFDCVPGMSDTLKIIYREWEAIDKEGRRSTTFDTINVLRTPALDDTRLHCAEADTLYCGSPLVSGPYLLHAPAPGSSICQRTYLVKTARFGRELVFSAGVGEVKCGLNVHVQQKNFSSGCQGLYRVDVEIKQPCPGGANTASCSVPGGNVIEQLDPEGTYWRCSFWVYFIDNTPPTSQLQYDGLNVLPHENVDDSGAFHCYDTPASPSNATPSPVVVVETQADHCGGKLYLPPLCVTDDCTDIKMVKATIEGIGTYVLSSTGTCSRGFLYQADQPVELSPTSTPYQILYEAVNECHYVQRTYAYVMVKDAVRPVAVSDKGLTVSLTDAHRGKKWVAAEAFSEGSWDNCGIQYMLARRSDWFEACVDLCDDTTVLCTYHDMMITTAHLDEAKASNEVEAHYAHTLQWLEEDSTACSDLILNGWRFDLSYLSSSQCQGESMTKEAFVRRALKGDCDIGLEALPRSFGCAGAVEQSQTSVMDVAQQIGGGWSKEVPFDCSDACGTVTVEILVVDYWCNWSTSWTEVYVEDKSGVRVARDVDHVELSCRTYKEAKYHHPDEVHPVSLEELVERAVDAEGPALDLLDDILGTYEKAWVDPYGNYVDAAGEELAPTISLADSTCVCTVLTTQVLRYDEHLGEEWVDSSYEECSYQVVESTLSTGIVTVNCAANVSCSQTVWSDLDHCGQGVVYRKFKIWQSCPSDGAVAHEIDTIVRVQQISVGNHCELSKAMFDLPPDAEVVACALEYDPSGSGNVVGVAHPDSVGSPVYRFDDDCRIVGVGHQDKVFRVVGGDAACHKILRTWYLADWCNAGPPTEPRWWEHYDIAIDTFVQKIIVIDTIPPSCNVTGPVADGGVIEAGGCSLDFQATVAVQDECGLISYYWELLELLQANSVRVIGHQGTLEGSMNGAFDVEVDGLEAGDYKLKVRVTDDCQNESYCTYEFSVQTGKKPSPVCITSLTVELNPMDLNEDGMADTAMSTIWAEEYNLSSRAPCGEDDDDLQFFIEVLGPGNPGSETLDTTVDLDSLNLGCAHIGVNTARLWVLSPTGSADFCDLALIVQNNMGGCEGAMSQMTAVLGEIRTEDTLMIAGVEVNAWGSEIMPQTATTVEDGAFGFLFDQGEMVSITPVKEGDPLNGVNTSDILLLFGHVTGTPLTTPYLRIAGDVNDDGILDATDLTILRDLVLLNIDAWPTLNAWRFIDASFVFQTMTPEAETYPEEVQMTLDGPDQRTDFVGVKIGDLDLDRITTLGRSGEVVTLQVQDRQVKRGERLDVRFESERLTALMGLQTGIRFDTEALEFEDFAPEADALAVRQDFGVRHIGDGLITCSWINRAFGKGAIGETLATISFVAKRDGHLSDMLALDGRQISSEVYPAWYERHPLALRFSDSGPIHVLDQNHPNPYREHTAIRFELGSEERGTLAIRDVTGRLVWIRQGNFAQGVHQVYLSDEDIGPSGVYFYTLELPSFTTTRKMIHLD